MAYYDAYVICTTPRSGSTLLCNILAATGKSGNPESWFHTPSLENWVRSYLKTPPGGFATSREVLHAVFQTTHEHGTKNTGIFGLRLQEGSFDYFMQQLTVAFPEIANDPGRFEAAFGKTLFIYLSRQDSLDQAISYTKANQTGLWHMAPDGAELERLSAPTEPVYNADEITRHLNEVNAGNLHWEQWFEREGIEPLRALYEDLSKDPAQVLKTIFDCLGLKSDPDYKVEPGVAKLADDISQSWKERYLSEIGS